MGRLLMVPDEFDHLPPPPVAAWSPAPGRQPRSSRRTWLIALLGPAVLWAGGCLIGAAHLPSAPPGVECTADTLACTRGTSGGSIFALVAGMIVIVPIVTALTAACAAIGRNVGRVLLGIVLALWAVESFSMALFGPG